MFRQDSVVAEVKCYFSPLDWVYGSGAKHWLHVLKALGLIPSTAQTEMN
jgi:hypothetical protein